MERSNTNGYTTGRTFRHTDLAGQDSAPQTTFVERPLAVVDGAEAVVYLLTALMIGGLAAYLWTRYSGRGTGWTS